MLRGELIGTLMQRRAMQEGPPAQQGQQPGWAVAAEPAATEVPPAWAAHSHPLPPPQPVEQPAQPPAMPDSVAVAATPKKRGRGRPRKTPSPGAAAGSALVAADDSAGLAGDYGAAVALAAYEDALSRQALASVTFVLQCKLQYGQRVRVVGNDDELGEPAS